MEIKVHQSISYTIKDGVKKETNKRYYKYNDLGYLTHEIYVNSVTNLLINDYQKMYYDEKGNLTTKIWKKSFGVLGVLFKDKKINLINFVELGNNRYINKYDNDGDLIEVENNKEYKNHGLNDITNINTKYFFEIINNRKVLVKELNEHFKKNKDRICEYIIEYDYDKDLNVVQKKQTEKNTLLKTISENVIKKSIYFNDLNEKVTENLILNNGKVDSKEIITKEDTTTFRKMSNHPHSKIKHIYQDGIKIRDEWFSVDVVKEHFSKEDGNELSLVMIDEFKYDKESVITEVIEANTR